MATVTVNRPQNQRLAGAAFLYSMLLAKPEERSRITSASGKFVEVGQAATKEQETITVELTDEEAATLVRAIDLVTGRDASLEPVREQLGGGETTVQSAAEEEDEDAGELDLLSILFGGEK